jgi:hypothetical protein
MKVIGFFQASTNALILPELRSEASRRLGDVTTGWSAVAVGNGGEPGFALGALSEEAAVDSALANCGQRGGVPCMLLAVDARFVVARHSGSQLSRNRDRSVPGRAAELMKAVMAAIDSQAAHSR